MPSLDEQVNGLDELTSNNFKLVKASEMKIKPPQYIIKNILESDSLCLLFGDPGTAKTFFSLDMSCCVATGKYFHSYKTKQGPVIYIAGEGQNGIKRRLNAWEIKNNQSLDDAPLFVSTMPVGLCDIHTVDTVVNAITETTRSAPSPALIVIDTVARNFGGGDENSTRDMNLFITAIDMLRVKYKCTILLVHHTGHADKTRARGAMSLKGALDAEYRIEKDETGLIRFEPTKMKDAELPSPLAFKLCSIDLGILDEDENKVTSAVLEVADYEPKPKGKKGRGKNQQIAISELKELYKKQRENLLSSGNDPITARVRIKDWQDACENEGVIRQRFNEAKNSLLNNGGISIENYYVYLA